MVAEFQDVSWGDLSLPALNSAWPEFGLVHQEPRVTSAPIAGKVRYIDQGVPLFFRLNYALILLILL